ncbi:complex I subunit 4 family protein [Terracidiphilus gabretensis]|uniref:complex I subunit 4 family protein n=1 Tax=Terracidiphilus gabretensis TaxID=1577687 RepID=UPI00071C09F3|nr:NADH-quinone oxidoreductase subunit M [Terracidiphilus gabretensis]
MIGTQTNGIPMLTLLAALPIVGAVIALFAGKSARLIAMLAAVASLAVALVVWAHLPSDGSMGFVERVAWAPSLGVEYHLGADGLSALMLVLSAIVALMSIDAAHRVHRQPNLYFALVLLLEAGLFGAFTAQNFFHWFLFWELSLIPAFFLIKLWGGSKRGPAATQFFVYTMAGSVALLLAFLGVFLATGSMDFEHLTLLASTGELEQIVTAHLGPVMPWLAVGVLAGFAVKVPLMPFHTWLPAAYSEAPSPVTMLLTGTMSKMGVYGMLRIALPLFGVQITAMRTPLLVLAVATVVMGAWAAAAQKDLKRVFAYSSVNHLGYCMLGIFALAVPATSAAMQASQAAALNGVILQMFNHGITAALLFWFIALLQERSGGIRGIDDFGGLRKPAPVFAGLMGIALFSSLGLPGLNGFVGEFLIFRGVFPLAWVAATVSVLGLLVTAAVILTVIQKVFTGPVPERWAEFPDLHTGERLALAPVIALMLLIGLLPQLIVDGINPTVVNLLAHWRF